MTASLTRLGALALALGAVLLSGCCARPDQAGIAEGHGIVEQGLSPALPLAMTRSAVNNASTTSDGKPLNRPINAGTVAPRDTGAAPQVGGLADSCAGGDHETETPGHAVKCQPTPTTPGLAASPAVDTLTDAQRQGLLQAYVTANLEFTLLHELSHAIFDEFKVPIFGHEEDAADTLATILMIRKHEIDVSTRESIRLLAVSEEWRLSWAADQATPNLPYWDAHALAIQRYYNVNCLLAGANPSAMNLLLGSPELPVDRGLYCQREFQQAKQFEFWLLAKYGRSPAEPAVAIDVQFDPPTDAQEAKVVAWLKNNAEVSDIINRAGDLLAWEHPISVEFASCVDPDSYYNELSRIIVICYQLPIEFGNRAERLMRTHSTAEICANRPLQYLIGEWVGCKPDDV